MKKKSIKIYLVLMFIASLFLNIGYAQVSDKSLEIEGTAVALAQDGVFILTANKVTQDESSSTINSMVKTIFDSKIELLNSTSEVTYEITIYNNTNTDKIFIDTITDKTDPLLYSNPNIDFYVNGLESYQTILKSRKSVTFTITFKYKNGANTSNNILESKLNFRFQEIPILNIDNENTTYEINEAYPDFTSQGYNFIVSNYDTQQVNGIPINYHFEISIDKPLTAKIYDQNSNEITNNILLAGDNSTEEEHEYVLKIIWDDNNQDGNIAYDDLIYSNKTFNCTITLKGTPDSDKYIGYEIIKKFYIEITSTEFGLEPIDPNDIPTSGSTFTRAYGLIDIQFLSGKSYTIGNPNPPIIDSDNMVPVNWNGSNWIVTNEENWDYSYDQTNKKWANVMLRDTLVLENMTNSQVQSATIDVMNGKKVTTPGSMLVWIPRYAYKISYYSSSSKTGTPVGYSDARGFTDSRGRTPNGMDKPVTSISVGNYYRPHPAFEDGSKTGFTQGEWNKRITGIWIGKFETTQKNNNKVTIRPNSATYISQSIGTFYTEAQNLNIANSHLIKNSEWGALAYLTESIYGRNKTAVTKNDALVSNKITTGEGNYVSNKNQSTTGNVYGVYDTVGGAYEYTAGYVADSSRNTGNSFASTNNSNNNKTVSTQYSTVYESTQNDSYSENYTENLNKKFGDAIFETSTSSSGSKSWYSAYSYFVGNYSGTKYPFISRSGYYKDTSAGTFSFSDYTGASDTIYGSRICFITE